MQEQHPQTIAYLEDLARIRSLVRKLLDRFEAAMDDPEQLKQLIGRASPVSTCATLSRMMVRVGQIEHQLLGCPIQNVRPASGTQIAAFVDQSLQRLEKYEGKKNRAMRRAERAMKR